MSQTIPKELFCEVIESLYQQSHHDKKHTDLLQEAFGINEAFLYDNSRLYKSIIKMLQVHFPKDGDGFCEIEHYVFDCGHGKVGEVSSAEQLYELLSMGKA